MPYFLIKYLKGALISSVTVTVLFDAMIDLRVRLTNQRYTLFELQNKQWVIYVHCTRPRSAASWPFSTLAV